MQNRVQAINDDVPSFQQVVERLRLLNQFQNEVRILFENNTAPLDTNVRQVQPLLADHNLTFVRNLFESYVTSSLVEISALTLVDGKYTTAYFESFEEGGDSESQPKI